LRGGRPGDLADNLRSKHGCSVCKLQLILIEVGESLHDVRQLRNLSGHLSLFQLSPPYFFCSNADDDTGCRARFGEVSPREPSPSTNRILACPLSTTPSLSHTVTHIQGIRWARLTANVSARQSWGAPTNRDARPPHAHHQIAVTTASDLACDHCIPDCVRTHLIFLCMSSSRTSAPSPSLL
jgi:hypothetical protein